MESSFAFCENTILLRAAAATGPLLAATPYQQVATILKVAEAASFGLSTLKPLAVPVIVYLSPLQLDVASLSPFFTYVPVKPPRFWIRTDVTVSFSACPSTATVACAKSPPMAIVRYQ